AGCRRRLGAVVNDPGPVPHVRNAKPQGGVPAGMLESRIKIGQERQSAVVERRNKSMGSHRRKAAVRWKYNVPAGIAGDDLRQHLLIALVGPITNPDAALPLESRDHLRIDIARPVEDIQAWASVACATRHKSARASNKNSPVHRSCSRCEIRITIPNATTTSAETALTTGLMPRRAMA